VVFHVGAKYFVLTSKHHDGFAMWDTARAFGWNSMVGNVTRPESGSLINPHKNGPFDALMQNGQKYVVSFHCLLFS
jgi:hypothetical protein